MVRKSFIIALFSFLTVLSVYSQTDKDVTKNLKAGIKNVEEGEYEQALSRFNKALDISLMIYPDSSKAVIACKSQIANVYFKLHDFRKALSLFKTVANYQREDFGTESYEYASQLSHIAACYASLGEYEQAIVYEEQALIIQEKYLDGDHLDYVFSLNSLSEYYAGNSQYDKAIQTAIEVAEIVGEAWGKDGEDYITALEFLFDRYVDAGEFNTAHDLGHDILNRKKAYYGARSFPYGEALSNMIPLFQNIDSLQVAIDYGLKAEENYINNKKTVHPYSFEELYERLAVVYGKTGETNKALECRKKVVEYEKINTANPSHNAQLAMAYIELSRAYEMTGDNGMAIVSAETSLEYANLVVNERSLFVVLASNRLADLYSENGRIQDAINITEGVIKIIEKDELGVEMRLDAINSVSCYYDLIGQSSKSIDYCLEYMNGAKSYYGGFSLEYVSALSNMGAFCCHAGNYDKALQYGKDAILLAEQLTLDNREKGYILAHIANTMGKLGQYEIEMSYLNKAKDCYSVDYYPSEYASVIDNIALTYCEMGDYDNALPFAKEAMEVRKKITNDSYYAYSLNNLSHIYTKLKEYDKAIELDKQAVEIRKKNGVLTPLYIASLQNLAADYYYLEMYAEAIALDSIALSLALQVFNPDSKDMIYANHQLACDYYQSRQYDKAIPYINRFFELQSQSIIKSLKGLNLEYKQSFWEKYINRMERATHYAIQLSDRPEMAKTAYNSILMMKGLLLTSTEEFERLTDNIQEPELIPIVREYKELKNKYNTYFNLSKEDRDKIYQNILDLEDKLIQSSSVLSSYTSSIESSWKDIRAKLNDGEVAVEFYLDDYYDYNAYCAIILRKEWEAPIVKYICLKEYIERLNSMGPEMFSETFNRFGYSGVWEPLEEYINKGDRVFFSTDDILQQTNIELFGLDSIGSITRECDLIRLSSTREILNRADDKPLSSAIIYGGLSYDIDSLTLIQLHNQYSSETITFTRGLQDNNGKRRGWEYLPFTAIEAKTIGEEFERNNIATSLYMGEDGTEESFKALSGISCSVLHIATHGFFLDNIEQSVDYLDRFTEEDEFRVDPMLRSGLIMSGGQKAWLGHEVPAGIEDGILLSKELSELDLSGIDIVVLSACDTGLGDVKNDGVFGLQRAFKLSGVRTIIMSLWELDDNVTSEFMSLFYQRLLEGYSRHEAFKQAQASIKKKYTNPYYWASFIMLD